MIGLLVIIFTPNLGPVRLGLAGAMFAAILVGVSWLLRAVPLLIDFTYPLLSTTAIYLTLIFASFVREQRQRGNSRRSRNTCRPSWSSSSRSRPKSSCSAARSAR